MTEVVEWHLEVAEPFPWAALLEYFSRRLIPGAEEVAANGYSRRLASGLVRVSCEPGAARLRVQQPATADANVVRARVAAVFDTTHVHEPVLRHLSRSEVLAPRIRKVPGMRPLGAWSAFELAIRTILGQQVTVAAAATLMGRVVARCGELTPQAICDADLRAIGMPGKRVEFVRALARAVVERRLDFEQPWKVVEAQLKELPGMGPWTRAYLAIRLGRDPDALPESDLGLIRAANVRSPRELLRLAEAWRPYRAFAATYLWAVS